MTLAQLYALLPPEASNGRTRQVPTGTGSDLVAMAQMGGR